MDRIFSSVFQIHTKKLAVHGQRGSGHIRTEDEKAKTVDRKE